MPVYIRQKLTLNTIAYMPPMCYYVLPITIYIHAMIAAKRWVLGDFVSPINKQKPPNLSLIHTYLINLKPIFLFQMKQSLPSN